jgi:hypothetical protein
LPRKKEGDTQARIHVWLFESDWHELKLMYGENIGPSKFVRLVVRQALKKVREKTNAQRGAASTASIDADLDALDSDQG